MAYLHQDTSLLSKEFDERIFFQYRSTDPAPGSELEGVVTYNMKHASDLDGVRGPVLVSECAKHSAYSRISVRCCWFRNWLPRQR